MGTGSRSPPKHRSTEDPRPTRHCLDQPTSRRRHPGDHHGSRLTPTGLIYLDNFRHGHGRPPQPGQLNPPPPTFLTCTATSGGTICSGIREVVKDPVDTGIPCGSGADAFTIYDQGFEHQRLTFQYDGQGNLASITNHERWTESAWSNPLTGARLPYTQNNIFTTVLATPGDFATATKTAVGEVIFTDPATGQKLLRNVGRAVVGPGGMVEFTSDKQPFFANDLSVFEPVCAALS